MNAGRPDAVAIAAALTRAEREKLLRLSAGEWGPAPELELSTLLLFHHGAPLISVMGDWARLTRLGAQVVQHLSEGAEQ